MINIVKLFFILLATILHYSCREENAVEKVYFQTGELKEEIENIDNTCSRIKTFDKKGNIKSVGKVCNGKKEGFWTEFYSNGKIKWKGEYKNNIRTYNNIVTNELDCEIKFENKQDSLIANKSYSLNVTIDLIHPNDVLIGTSNAISNVKKDSKNETQNFIITPNGNGDIILYTFAVLNGERVLVCKDIIPVKPVNDTGT